MGLGSDQKHFNPRAHAGRDGALDDTLAFESISIHAPTRGATSGNLRLCGGYTDFNPRAHAGRDLGPGRPPLNIRYFNPRAHAGRDDLDDPPLDPVNHFNPRAHAGRDRTGQSARVPDSAFQSTRPRGARLMAEGRDLAYIECISIHAPTRGATGSAGGLDVLLLQISIHAPTRGAT